MHIIDIASTEQHLWRALNVLSHLAYSGGSVLFVNNRPGYKKIVKVKAWILYNYSVYYIVYTIVTIVYTI